MINKYMTKKEDTTDIKPVEETKKPNENLGFIFSSSVKISDPNTKEVLVQIRGDN
jgi:hypothetical protein